jgi:hypothetical protein
MENELNLLPVYSSLDELLADHDLSPETEEEDGPGWDLYGWDGEEQE